MRGFGGGTWRFWGGPVVLRFCGDFLMLLGVDFGEGVVETADLVSLEV